MMASRRPANPPSAGPHPRRGRMLRVIALVLVVAAGAAAVYLVALRGPQSRGRAACLSNSVTYIVDGDTLDVGGARVRLSLVNTPEVGQAGYQEPKDFTAHTCPVGTQALVDEDDGQIGGSYGRMIAVVYCGQGKPERGAAQVRLCGARHLLLSRDRVRRRGLDRLSWVSP